MTTPRIRIGRPLICLGVIALLGCAGDVRIERASGTDFSQYRTWGWQPRAAGEASGAPSDLHIELARQIHRGLLDRGLVYDRSDPDLLVAPQLRVTRHRVAVRDTPAIQTLHSLHSSPSYQVQVTRTRMEDWEMGQLFVVVRDAHTGREIWQGHTVGRHRDDFTPHVGDTVATLLGHFPMQAPPSADTGPKALARANERADRRPEWLDAFDASPRP